MWKVGKLDFWRYLPLMQRVEESQRIGLRNGVVLGLIIAGGREGGISFHVYLWRIQGIFLKT